MRKLLVCLLILLTLAVPASAAFDLPEGLTVIEQEAFANTAALTGTMTIPDGVTTIGESAFAGCTGVTEFVLPDSVTEIKDGAFSGCTAVEQITLPESVTTIGSNAFADCGSLETLVLPESVTSVGEGAFSGCTDLTVTVMGDASVIPEDVLADCGEVIVFETAPVEDFAYTVTAEGTVTITKYNGSAEVVAVPEMIEGCPVTEIGDQAFFDNAAITTVSLPETVLRIGESVFYSCDNLQRIYGTENVVEFGILAMADCTELDSMPLAENIQKIGDSAFRSTSLTGTLLFPYSLYENGISMHAVFESSLSALFYEVTENNEITICMNLQDVAEVTIPSTISGMPITAIGAEVFYALQELVIVNLPETLVRIEDRAFADCNKLQQVYGSQNVTYYGEWAFGGCEQLTVFELGDNIQSVGNCAFLATNAPCETKYICNNGSIGETGFDASKFNVVIYEVTDNNEATIVNANLIGDFVIPEEIQGYPVTGIGEGAFLGLDALSSIVLPESLTSIGEQAFQHSGVQSINIPSKLTVLAPYCFYGILITEITIPETVKVIGQAALADTDLTSLIIPDTVEEIGDYLATGCEYLTEVRLPSNLTYVGTCAFAGCTSLETLHLPDTVTTFGMAVFENTPSLREVNIPASLTQTLSCTFRDSGIVTRAVDALVAEIITDDMTDFEKALVLHDYIINHTEYDLSAPCFHGAEGVLLYGRGVCDSYAEAYYALLNKVGIENHIVYGDANGAHAWNLVQLDGEWYHIDCTWDDPLPNGNENHQYFGLTDELMSQDHTWTPTDDMPAATGTRYQYGVDNGQ